MKYHFKEYGEGKPVVLLHAFPLNRTMWQQQVEPLTRVGCRVILPDLKGFGDNKEFSDISSMEEMALDVVSLLDDLKIERAVIGGLSMGGYVTFNIYRLCADKFSGMLLFDTNAAADTEEKRRSRFDLIDKIKTEGIQAIVESMLPNLIGDSTKITNPELVEKVKNLFYETSPQSVIAALRGLAERLDHSDLLPQISVPALLVFGAEDKVTTPEIATTLDSLIPDSELFIIPNVGHFSNLENPEAFNKILVEFVRKIEI